jgi:hypothetical protein
MLRCASSANNWSPTFVVRLLALCCCSLLVQVNAEVRFLLARLNFSDFYTRSPAADKGQQ